MLGYVTPLSHIFHGCFLAFQKEAKHVSFDSSAIAFLSGSFPHVPHHFWNIVNNCGLYTCSSFICLVNVVLLLSLLCTVLGLEVRKWIKHSPLSRSSQLPEEDRQNREDHSTQSANWSFRMSRWWLHQVLKNCEMWSSVLIFPIKISLLSLTSSYLSFKLSSGVISSWKELFMSLCGFLFLGGWSLWNVLLGEVLTFWPYLRPAHDKRVTGALVSRGGSDGHCKNNVQRPAPLYFNFPFIKWDSDVPF